MKRFKARQIYLLFILILSGFLITGCGGSGGVTETGHWLPKDVVSIEVTPPNPIIAMATTQQFMATGIYVENAHFDLTSSVIWSSSNTNVATISNGADGPKGLAHAVTAGTTTITATDPATGIYGYTTLTVKPAPVTLMTIEVTPPDPTIALGTNQPFIATGIYSDATTQNLTSSVTWTSSNTGIATINTITGSIDKGLAHAVTAGTITITATDPATEKYGYTTLTVKPAAVTLLTIEVTPPDQSIALGTNQRFIATGIYSDATTQNLTSSAAWSSSDTGIATINTVPGSIDKGLAHAVTAGTITITATDPATEKSGHTTLTVKPAAVTPMSIEVTPTYAIIPLGLKQQFIAMVTYTDGTKQNQTSLVTWSTPLLATPIASISNAADGSNGLATSLHEGGPIEIKATVPHTLPVISGTAQLKVIAATLVSIAVTPVNPSIAKGTTQQFKATGTYTDATTADLTTSVTWVPSHIASATISNAAGSKGLATAKAVGTTTIRAFDPTTHKFGDSILTVTNATLVSLEVTPADAGISVGATQQFIATGTYTDDTTQDLTSSVTWSTPLRTTPVASISNAPGFNGLATALTVGGPIRIHAIDPTTRIFGNAKLTVTNAPILGAAARFGTFGGTAGMTNSGNLTVITGSDGNTADIGTIATDNSAIVGFHEKTGLLAADDHYTDTLGANSGKVTGLIYTCTVSTTGDEVATVNAAECGLAKHARLDAEKAYIALAALPSDGVLAGNLAGSIIYPGVWTGGSVLISGGNVTLDAQGDANALFVFQIASTLTVGDAAVPRSVILAGGAQAKNVFWQVGTAATINPSGGGTMVGTIITSSGVTFSTADVTTITTLNGRALSLGASVTMVNTVINVPAP